MSDHRIERDSMGELEVPVEALYGAQTQRAVNNFPVSGQSMPTAFIYAIARIKLAAARVNRDLGLLDAERAEAIVCAAEAVLDGSHDEQFPVDVFQTGSGTSSNMNVNEVIARLASRDGLAVGPNDHVNMGQSSNDVIPTAIHLSAALEVQSRLRPALVHLRQTIEVRAAELDHVVKTGRTHLMDAMPLRMSQELGGWSSQVGQAIERLDSAMVRLCRLAQGGTAVGSGINAHPEFAVRMARDLSQQTGLVLAPNDSFFAGLASQDAAVELSGQLRGLACVVMKIAKAQVAPGRGGVLCTAFDISQVDDSRLTHDRVYAEDEMWGNYEYFLRAVLPVAEESGVRLALHPDDPPLSPLRGIGRGKNDHGQRSGGRRDA